MFMTFKLSKMSHVLSLFTGKYQNILYLRTKDQSSLAITKSYAEMRKKMTANLVSNEYFLDTDSDDGCKL